MSINKSSSGTGISITSVLFIVFLVLKLTNNINWSWWWVTSPLWIPIALFMSIISLAILMIIVALIFGANIEDIKSKSEKIKAKLK
jgi:hypothetical protein